MKFQLYFLLLFIPVFLFSQEKKFDIQPIWNPKQTQFDSIQLQLQILFVGGVDVIQTLDKMGKPNGQTFAKQRHDFIGFTLDTSSELFSGWVSVNHEMIWADDKIGDGGGMTNFKIVRNRETDTFEIQYQQLVDGRKGDYFNVDFLNTVGETGMNCGGIVSCFDGRIWTAEEWYLTENDSENASHSSLYWGEDNPFEGFTKGKGVRDTNDYKIKSTLSGKFDGVRIKKYQNFNWMVEIDPKNATAIRKQYNWGRLGFESGVILPDNKTVYLFEDMTPGFFVKFVAEVEGDFTKGDLFVYKESNPSKWEIMPNDHIDSTIKFREVALRKGATMFNRLEWGVFNDIDGCIYFTETGKDSWTKSILTGSFDKKISFSNHFIQTVKTNKPNWLTNSMTDSEILDSVKNGAFHDYYGRILRFNPKSNDISLYLDGGSGEKTENHLSQPDGLTILKLNDKSYIVINEDLNGKSMGRVPSGVKESICEVYMIDMDKNPTIDNLTRIAVVPEGAEVTWSLCNS